MSPPTRIDFTPGDEKWRKLRAKALADPYFFVADILGMGPVVPMKASVHKALVHIAAGTTGIEAIDQAPYKLLQMPRDTGKSACITRSIPLWNLCRNPETCELIVAHKVDLAKKFLQSIKFQIESNALLRALFPEIVPPDTQKTIWSAEEIVIPRQGSRGEPSLKVTGVGGSVVGFHPNRIHADDLISEEEADAARIGNYDLMRQVTDWATGVYSLLDKNTKPVPQMTIICTPWWSGDAYEDMEKLFGLGEEPKWYTITVTDDLTGERSTHRLYRRGDIVVFRRPAVEDGRSLFPEKWSLEDLAKLRMQNPTRYAAQYALSPADNLTTDFRETWLDYYDWVDAETVVTRERDGKPAYYRVSDLDVVMAIDPGGFGLSRGQDRMRPAVVVTGTTPTGRHLLLEAKSDPGSYLDCANHALAFASQYKVRKCGVEIAGQQIAFYDLLGRLAKDRGISLYLEQLPAGKQDKDVRILELEPYFERGQFVIGKGAKFHEFREQYRLFPKVARKDILDAMANLPRLWRGGGHGGGGMNDIRRLNDQALHRYRQSRGIA